MILQRGLKTDIYKYVTMGIKMFVIILASKGTH